ncbi:MAG: proline dehydrogenase family protein [Campylobacterales bacterium]|nr:proline dehydrogenase family protein [Campylobacterales bacterium]
MPITTATFENVKTVAARWQSEIEHTQGKTEQKFHALMERMLKDPMNKLFLIELLDQSFRSKESRRVAEQLEYLFDKYGKTDVFSPFEEMLVWLFRHAGIYLPDISVALFIRYLRDDISNVVIKGEDSALSRHLRLRRKEHTRVNINIIGEAVLGEQEAAERIQKYIRALQNPDIDYLSVKISTLFSQIVPLAHDYSVTEISHRLQKIYEAAMQHSFVNAEGKRQHKFVNLDMEEYRDVQLTLDVFMQTLSQERFHAMHAGIVLQAYLPDTLNHLKRLITWAKERAKNGGAPIKVRLVKGANQEMELTEASLRGWPCVTYLNKAETDANFKLLLDLLLSPEVAPYVHTGLASHNLFDHALGMALARERHLEAYYTAEMLEGMSETAYRLLKKEKLQVILYAPTATAETFTNAIAYLVRRFDENTAEQNFLRHSFGLKVDSPAWVKLVKSYDDALKMLPQLRLEPYRKQDRNAEVYTQQSDPDTYRFENESDTDFALPKNRRWAEAVRDTWKNISENGGYHADPVVAGRALHSEQRTEVPDKSQYHKKVIVGSYSTASSADLDEAVRISQADPDGWRTLDVPSRQKILMDVAQEFKKSRGDLIGIAAAEVGKVFTETDVEVSEAIDFLNFYADSVKKISALEGIQTEGKGVGLVVSPWNFPIAIPVGGIAAALASGNTVILKPSSNAVLCAQRLCECFWEGGVSRNTLQFVPSSGALAGEKLIPNPAIDFVIFTGGEETAYTMIQSRPEIHISAETGGKNATIVTSLADRDQAVKNVVASAFNNSGQKCSATSLLVLEKELYEDEAFKRMLIDASASLEVGSVWEFKNRIGSLVAAPSGNLKHSLALLDENESWAIAPSYADNSNPYMLKPSIRWGTKKGDFCHMNELFGPVLSVLCANDLEEAIAIVNATGYGLTSGLESLDEREQALWKERILAGNLYINRMTTGAIVRRQPFGGMRKSAIGSGKKAGGFNYVAQFMKIEHDRSTLGETRTHPYIQKLEALLENEVDFADEIKNAAETASYFAYWLDTEFFKAHDYSNIRGEHNTIRYLPLGSVLLRFEESDTLYEMLSSVAAVKMSGAELHISLPASPQSKSLLWLSSKRELLLDGTDSFVLQETSALQRAMREVERIRFLHAENVSAQIYKDAAKDTLHIASEPFVPHGRIELMHYFIEQSISDSFHRYGNLGLQGMQEKEH